MISIWYPWLNKSNALYTVVWFCLTKKCCSPARWLRGRAFTRRRENNNAGVERPFFFQNSRTQQRIKSFSSATAAKPWNCIPLNIRSLPKHKFEAAIRHLAWEFVVSPTNDVWETIAGIPYRWRVTTQIWVVLLIGWNKFPTRRDQSELRSTTQIWVVTRHQYGISALVSQMSFVGQTSGSVAKCRLFSQATILRQPLHILLFDDANINTL